MTYRERFDAKWIPEPTSGCWLWIGSTLSHGYGLLKGAGKSNILAHRSSWELHHGDIPSGQFVLHRCDTPSCVNPNHLFLGDQAKNMEDCAKKNRTAAGEDHGRAKLSNAQIERMWWLRSLGLSYEHIGNAMGISLSHAHAVLTGRKRTKLKAQAVHHEAMKPVPNKPPKPNGH